MTTTTERIAAILDEDTATSRATIADMERRLSNAFREIVELKQAYGVTVTHGEAGRGATISAAIADALRRDKDSIQGSLRDLRVAAAQAQNALLDQDMLIDDLNRQLDEAHKENARLVLERPYHTAPVVEEQGPWVVTRESVDGFDYYNSPLMPDWATTTAGAIPFSVHSDAKSVAGTTSDRFGGVWFVRTLAEARAIEAKRG